ncbi:unnamed protein product [Chrysoparadoxa australica]
MALSRRELAMFTVVRGLENPLPEHAPPAEVLWPGGWGVGGPVGREAVG